jgi:hypothetical protein
MGGKMGKKAENNESYPITINLVIGVLAGFLIPVIQLFYLKLPWVPTVIFIICGIFILLLSFLSFIKIITIRTKYAKDENDPDASKTDSLLQLILMKFFDNRQRLFVITLLIATLTLSSIYTKLTEPTEKENVEAFLLSNNMKNNISTEYVSLNTDSLLEIGENNGGNYYSLDLIDITMSESLKVLYFDAGEYTFPNFNSQFIYSLDDLADLVLQPLSDANIDYEIYVKGRADIAGDGVFEKSLLENYKYQNIEYYPLSGKNKFSKKKQVWDLGDQYTNKDLPLLRAKFIQETLSAEPFKLKKPQILEGRVSPKETPLDRNVMIYLYIKWPDYFNTSG